MQKDYNLQFHKPSTMDIFLHCIEATEILKISLKRDLMDAQQYYIYKYNQQNVT
jgi:hypothetical protein